jgi:hypothetical protein
MPMGAQQREQQRQQEQQEQQRLREQRRRRHQQPPGRLPCKPPPLASGQLAGWPLAMLALRLGWGLVRSPWRRIPFPMIPHQMVC